MNSRGNSQHIYIYIYISISIYRSTDKQDTRDILLDITFLSDSKLKEKEYEKLEKYQARKEELGRMWGIKASVVPLVIRALVAVTPKLGEWLQQIPGTKSKISVQKSAILGAAEILSRIPWLPGLWLYLSGITL